MLLICDESIKCVERHRLDAGANFAKSKGPRTSKSVPFQTGRPLPQMLPRRFIGPAF